MISIWEKETFLAPQDVIILGSGFVGLWSAFYLKKKHPKLKVSVLDRGIIPTGASTRNAGFACFGSLSELMYDARTMGSDKMLQLVEMRYKGLERIRKYFNGEVIDFELCGGYELFNPGSSPSSEEIDNHIEYINSLLKPVTGTKKTFRKADDRISTFGFGQTQHLVKNDLEGCLHSGKLLRVLLQTVQGMGVQVFTAVEVRNFHVFDETIELETNRQFSFFTKKLLVCTNAFAKELLEDLDVVPARGQVVLTSPIQNLPWRGTFHSEEGYYYFRNLGDRVLLGGARHKAFAEEQTTAMEISDKIQGELEHYLATVVLPHYAGKYSIEHRWSGIMAMGGEKMPIVKQVLPNVFCAVRMSGMGVALAPVVGREVTSLVMA